jgi:hypothetical protein
LLGWIINHAGLENQNRAESRPIPACCGLNEQGLRERMYNPTDVMVRRDNVALPKIKPKRNNPVLLG